MNKIGRYEITGRLGRGGMSTVYKARSPFTGRIVALKVLKPRDDIFEDLVGRERLVELFLEEARIMGSITHDHVAKVIDCDLDGDVPFIVLEYFSHSIGEFIGEAYKVEQQTRAISIPRTFIYMCQALKGLERLHFAGIVHRDIKPYNMMITNDDRVKLIDFGLSRVRGEQSLAIPGMQVGSPYYAAPEQMAAPDGADGRADLFSLGILMYRMLTGVLVDHTGGDPAPASAVNPDLSAAWDDLLARVLQRKPEERFASALDMRLALEAVYRDWESHSANQCQFQPGFEAAAKEPPEATRSEPARLMYKDVRRVLDLDALFRPRAFFRHRLQVTGPLVLYDPVTGLNWQRRGSGFTLTWAQAGAYIDYLNRERFEGRTDWRLPTTPELVTILRPPTVERDICLDPSFDPSLHWLWSADHCTKKQAWMADLVESFIGRLDMEGTASVCAVCG